MSKLVRSVFPLLIVLRLSDQQEPFMDKIYFYVRQMDSTLIRSQLILDEVEKQFKGTSWRSLDEMDTTVSLSDDDDSYESDHDTETCAEEDERDETSTLGKRVMEIWNKRRNKLINDFTIAGWMLSPISEVYMDSQKNADGQHRDAVDRLLKKMYASNLADDSDELSNLFNDFWDEFELFKSRAGPFQKSYIWKDNNPDLQHGRSYMWHKKNSLPFTKIFGRFACRVCSKIVGMGSAERNWGDVKHLKTDKRSHMSSEAVQKQATIFGASCMLNARIERESKKGTDDDPYKFWTEDDYDNEFSSFSHSKKKSTSENCRVFKCYFEDWEKECLHRKDDISKAKFLQKYGGLEFDDVDAPVHWWIDPDRLHFQRRSKKEDGGWCVLAKNDLPTGNDDDDDDNQDVENNEDCSTQGAKNKDKLEKWSLFEDCALIDCIASYYTLNPRDTVKLIMRKGQLKEIQSLTLCGGCGDSATPHHKCDKCNANMHLSCGRVIGEVKERSTVRCQTCDQKKKISGNDGNSVRKKIATTPDHSMKKKTTPTPDRFVKNKVMPTPDRSVKKKSSKTLDAVLQEKILSSLTICGGCGDEAGPVHRCDMCFRHMHPFCGRTIGEEGYGAPVRCPGCDK